MNRPKIYLGFSQISARDTGKKREGIPDWESVKTWLDPEISTSYPAEEEKEEIKIEHKEIEKLEKYDVKPEESFWRMFPKKDLPKRAETRINTKNLATELRKIEGNLSPTELKRAKRILSDLRTGAEAYQKSPPLPPITVLNSESCFKYGQLLTDKLVSWIKKGFVAGPFDYPPLPGFRANPLAVIERNNKIRPVLNMSSPKNMSFNDNIEKRKLEKVHMSTAKSFSYGLRKEGEGAIFSKFDIQDAYKLVPAKVEDLHLQGFKWLDKYFCETRETFGSVASVCNFDRLSKTRDLIICLQSKTPRDKVFGVLDDTVCVAGKDTGITEKFSEEMKRLCKFIDLPLAKNCPSNDKAFECQTRGIVLGIGFDSSNLEWFLPETKARKVIRR